MKFGGNSINSCDVLARDDCDGATFLQSLYVSILCFRLIAKHGLKTGPHFDVLAEIYKLFIFIQTVL